MIYMTFDWDRELSYFQKDKAEGPKFHTFSICSIYYTHVYLQNSFEQFPPKRSMNTNLFLDYTGRYYVIRRPEMKEVCIFNAFTFVQQWPYLNHVFFMIFWFLHYCHGILTSTFRKKHEFLRNYWKR